MATLQNVLIRQAAIPANLEASIPVLPKMSGIMAQLATAIPAGIQIPELPAMGMTAAPFTTGMTSVIKGIEDVLPAGVPKVSEGVMAFGMGGYRPVAVEEKKNNGNSRGRILGSGYRSI